MLFSERKENTPKLLAPKMIDAGVAREPEEPGLKLGRRLEPVNRPHHLDEDLLGQVLDGIAATGDGIDKPRHPVLVADDELALSGFVSPLSSANEITEGGRRSVIHAVVIAIPG